MIVTTVQSSRLLDTWRNRERRGRKPTRNEPPFIQEIGLRSTPAGPALYIKVRTANFRRLYWTEVQATVSESYPGRWAVQAFPPNNENVDEANIYHLLVFEEGQGDWLNIRRKREQFNAK